MHTRDISIGGRTISIETGRVAKQAGADAKSRIETAFRIAYGRKPSAKEFAWSLDSLHQLTDRYRTAKEDAENANQKALAALCHTLLNTNEFLYIE